jgi:hypothetical protein
MTSPGPAGPFAGPAESVRTLAVWALLGYAALLILFALFDWLLPSDPGGFSARSAGAGFVTVPTMAAPLLAVLLAAYVSPPLTFTRLAALAALLEYAAILVFGMLALLIGLPAAFNVRGDAYAPDTSLDGLAYLLIGVAELALVAIAALAVWRVYAGLGGRLGGGRLGGRTARPTPSTQPPPPPA